MKRLLAALGLASLALTASGCIVTAVYPFYSDATAVFDPALIGKWQDGDGQTTWTFAKEGDKAYRVTAVERKRATAGEAPTTETTTFVVHAFKLNGSEFLDVFRTGAPDLFTGTHFLAKADVRDDTLTVRGLDVDAVDRAAGTAVLHAHLHDDGTVAQAPGGQGFAGTLLLAPTAQLQAFVEQHGSAILEKDGGTMKKVVGTDAVSR